MKRNPNNLKNQRRIRAAARLEARMKLQDKDLLATAKCLRTDPNIGTVAYREQMKAELERTKAKIV